MTRLQIRLIGPYLSSFSTNSYGYYSQKSQNLFSNSQIFVSVQIVRQATRQTTKTIKGFLGRITGLPSQRLCCLNVNVCLVVTKEAPLFVL